MKMPSKSTRSALWWLLGLAVLGAFVVLVGMSASAHAAPSAPLKRAACLSWETTIADGWTSQHTHRTGMGRMDDVMRRSALIFAQQGVSGAHALTPRSVFLLGMLWADGYALSASGVPEAQAVTNLLGRLGCGTRA